MRQKIEVGADVDLFASADMAQARRLAIGHPERFVVNFTRNQRDEDTSWHRNLAGGHRSRHRHGPCPGQALIDARLVDS
jgi:hypothetical protein